jgi:hypothetical protein
VNVRELRDYAARIGHDRHFRMLEERAEHLERQAEEARRADDRAAFALLARRVWRAAVRLVLDAGLSAKLRRR